MSLITYAAPQGTAPSGLYRVTVNGKPVFVYPCRVSRIVDENDVLLEDRHMTTHTMPAAFCYFDCAGRVEVEVEALGPAIHFPLTSAVIRPLRHGIQPEIAGQTLRFSLEGPCKLSIEPNGAIVAPLMLFANPIEEEAPPRPDDPAVRYFGPGEHILGLYDKVRSGETIYIAGGAVVRGHIWGADVDHVTVRGRGILDCSRSPGEDDGGARANEYGICGRMMRWYKSSDIRIDGIILLDSPSWGIEMTHCDRIDIRNLKIISCRGASDAMDVCSCEDVTVDDCFVRNHDDCLNVKGLTDLGYPADAEHKWTTDGVRKPARHIRYTRCVVWNDRAHALMIGPETRAQEISDVVFRDIDIIHALSVEALSLFSGDGAEIRDIRYENIRIEDLRTMGLFGIRIGHTYVTADAQRGAVRNVTYKDIDVTPPWPYSAAYAENEKGCIEGVTYENVRIGGQAVRTAPELKLDIRGPVSGVRFVDAGT